MAAGTWGPTPTPRTLAPLPGWHAPAVGQEWQDSHPIGAPANETDAQRAARVQADLMAQYNTAGRGRDAPQATAAQAGAASSASYSPYASERAPGAQQAAFSPYSAATASPAQQVEMTRLGQAALVGMPSLGVERSAGVQVGEAQRAPNVNVGYTPGAAVGSASMAVTNLAPQWATNPMDMEAARIGEMQRAAAVEAQGGSLGSNDQLRARQMSLLDYLEGSAKGTNGPSAAEMQFQRNLDKSISAQHAQAAQARGTGTITANLTAGHNIAELTGEGAAQSAMLRAQEQQQARAQLLAGLESTRGQDISVAGLQQQLSIANSQLQTATNQFNAGQINQAQLAQAQLQQQAAQTNLQKNTSMSQFNTGLEAQRQRDQAGLRTQVELANADIQTRAGLQMQQIAAQRNQLQAQIDMQGGMFNADQANQMQRLQAQMEQANNQFNAGQGNQVGIARAQIGTQVGIANAGAKNSFAQQQAALNSNERLANMGAENQMSMFNVGQQNAAGMQNSQLGAQVGMFNTGQTNQTNQFNTGQANQVGMFNAGQSSQVGMFNAGQTNETGRYNAGLQNQVNLQNSDAQLRQQAQDDARRNNLMNQYLAASGQQMNANQFNASTDEQRKRRALDMIANGVQQAGTLGAIFAVSDERAKTDIKPLYSDERGKAKAKLLDSVGGSAESGDDVGQLLDNLKAYKFRYKDTSETGTAPGERYGIMAQDLEKSPMGASIVIDDGGRKKIDTAQAVGVLLAAMARQNQKIKKLEKR